MLLLAPLLLSSQAVMQAAAVRAIADVQSSFFMIFSFWGWTPPVNLPRNIEKPAGVCGSCAAVPHLVRHQA